MATKQIAKSGRVSITDRDGKLYLMFNAAGKKVWESTGEPVKGTKIPSKVQARVKEINESFAAQRGKATLAKLGVHVPEPKKQTDRVYLDDAIEQTIKIAASDSDKYKDDLRAFSKYFQKFMRDHFAMESVPYWDEITQVHVIEYILAQQAAGNSNKTIRHYIAPIIATSRIMADLHPATCRPLAINMKKYLPIPRKKMHHLSLEQILKLEPLCRKSRSEYVMPLFMFGCFAGLISSEIQGLQKKDWDSENGTINIRQAKTVYRPRLIPVCQYLRAWCDEAFGALANKDSYLVTTDSGNPLPQGDFKRMGRAFTERILKPAVEHFKDESFLIIPSDCRESFINMLVAAKVQGDAQRAYTGHAPSDVHAANYADYSKIEVLQEQVIRPLEKHFKVLKSGSKVVAEKASA